MSETKKDNFKYAMCYIPFVAIVIYFIEDNKSKELQKHINYGIILLALLVVINMVFNSLYLGFLAAIATLLYIIASGYLWYKIYSWEEVEVDILNKIEKKVKNFSDKNEEKGKDVFKDEKDVFKDDKN